MNNAAKTQILDILENIDADSLMIYLMEAGQKIGEKRDFGQVEDHQQMIAVHGEMMQVAALLKIQ